MLRRIKRPSRGAIDIRIDARLRWLLHLSDVLTAIARRTSSLLRRVRWGSPIIASRSTVTATVKRRAISRVINIVGLIVTGAILLKRAIRPRSVIPISRRRATAVHTVVVGLRRRSAIERGVVVLLTRTVIFSIILACRRRRTIIVIRGATVVIRGRGIAGVVIRRTVIVVGRRTIVTVVLARSIISFITVAFMLITRVTRMVSSRRVMTVIVGRTTRRRMRARQVRLAPSIHVPVIVITVSMARIPRERRLAMAMMSDAIVMLLAIPFVLRRTTTRRSSTDTTTRALAPQRIRRFNKEGLRGRSSLSLSTISGHGTRWLDIVITKGGLAVILDTSKGSKVQIASDC